ncbi:hypothetical protein SOVF_210520, partial [Spinacia oleracea]
LCLPLGRFVNVDSPVSLRAFAHGGATGRKHPRRYSLLRSQRRGGVRRCALSFDRLCDSQAARRLCESACRLDAFRVCVALLAGRRALVL